MVAPACNHSTWDTKAGGLSAIPRPAKAVKLCLSCIHFFPIYCRVIVSRYVWDVGFPLCSRPPQASSRVSSQHPRSPVFSGLHEHESFSSPVLCSQWQPQICLQSSTHSPMSSLQHYHPPSPTKSSELLESVGNLQSVFFALPRSPSPGS